MISLSYLFTMLLGGVVLTALILSIPKDWDAKEWTKKVLDKVLPK